MPHLWKVVRSFHLLNKPLQTRLNAKIVHQRETNKFRAFAIFVHLEIFSRNRVEQLNFGLFLWKKKSKSDTSRSQSSLCAVEDFYELDIGHKFQFKFETKFAYSKDDKTVTHEIELIIPARYFQLSKRCHLRATQWNQVYLTRAWLWNNKKNN